MDLKATYDPFYLQQKILKDYHDIMILITNCEIDFNLLREQLEKLNFYDYFKSLCDKIEMKQEIAFKTKKNWKTIKKEFIQKLDSQ